MLSCDECIRLLHVNRSEYIGFSVIHDTPPAHCRLWWQYTIIINKVVVQSPLQVRIVMAQKTRKRPSNLYRSSRGYLVRNALTMGFSSFNNFILLHQWEHAPTIHGSWPYMRDNNVGSLESYIKFCRILCGVSYPYQQLSWVASASEDAMWAEPYNNISSVVEGRSGSEFLTWDGLHLVLDLLSPGERWLLVISVMSFSQSSISQIVFKEFVTSFETSTWLLWLVSLHNNKFYLATCLEVWTTMSEGFGCLPLH